MKKYVMLMTISLLLVGQTNAMDRFNNQRFPRRQGGIHSRL